MRLVVTTTKSVMRRDVEIKFDECPTGLVASRVIRQCIRKDNEGRPWYKHSLFETYRVVGMHRRKDKWVVTVESSRRLV